MPFFWRRKRDQYGQPPAAASSTPVTGDRPCSEPGCQRQDAAACSYMDRRRVSCPTAWCPDHQVQVNGAVYCHRHASTVRGIGADSLSGGPAPLLENRAPSLVTWIGDGINERILAALRAEIRPGSQEQVTSSAVRLVKPPDGHRIWDRNWSLFDHTGALLKVSIEVDEANDSEVVARVGRVMVAKGVPPWIQHRMRKESVDAETDARERQAYFDFICAELEKGIKREVELGMRYLIDERT